MIKELYRRKELIVIISTWFRIIKIYPFVIVLILTSRGGTKHAISCIFLSTLPKIHIILEKLLKTIQVVLSLSMRLKSTLAAGINISFICLIYYCFYNYNFVFRCMYICIPLFNHNLCNW